MNEEEIERIMERHNALARMYVASVARKTQSLEEFMVVIESVLLGSMLAMQKWYHLSPEEISVRVELLLQKATEQFTVKRLPYPESRT